LIKIFFFIRFH